jgi:hypothetical protein
MGVVCPRLRRDPERFHVEKSCIYQDLEYLAEHCDARSDPKITVSRLRRSTSVAIIGGKRVTAQPALIEGLNAA